MSGSRRVGPALIGVTRCGSTLAGGNERWSEGGDPGNKAGIADGPRLRCALVAGTLPAMLSSRAKYAVRATLHLAANAGMAGWIPTARIAERESIPRKFLEAILVELRSHGLLESRLGRGGGHRLRRPPGEISLADIIRIVDGPLALAPCASCTQFRVCKDCPSLASCRLRGVLQEARDAMAAVLESYTLQVLLETEPCVPDRGHR